MFYHAYDGYKRHAFPADELKPLTCVASDAPRPPRRGGAPCPPPLRARSAAPRRRRATTTTAA